MKRAILFLLMLLICISIFSEEEFVPGKEYRNVQCKFNPDTHFNLRLPSGYDPKTKSPVMFIFSPTGNAGFRLFKKAAEELGWILVGSVECKNGPWDTIMKHQAALFEEITMRFAVDKKMMFASGMSGGARMSYMMLYRYPDNFMGIIPMGAGDCGGSPVKRRPVKHATVYGLVGDTCFNNKEMHEFKREIGDYIFKECILKEFKGGHEWAPSTMISEAMRYLDEKYYQW